MNNYEKQNQTVNPNNMYYEPIIVKAKTHPLFYATEWILPVIFLIITITQFNKLNTYSLYDYMVTGTDPESVRAGANFWLIVFVFTFFLAIVDCIGMSMRTLQLTQTRIIGRTGITNFKALNDLMVNIKQIKVSHGVFGKAFGYGTITVVTSSGKFKYKNIKDADLFESSVRNMTAAGNNN